MTNSKLRSNVEITSLSLIFLCCSIILAVPYFFNLLFAIFLLALNNKRIVRMYVYISSSLFAGFINSTRLPEADLAVYLKNFDNVHNGTLLAAFDGTDTNFEPGYVIFSKIIAYVSDGNHTIFIISFTMLIYFVLLVAYDNYIRTTNRRTSKIIFISIVCYLLFFPSLFSLTSHIVRQSIAIAICIFALARFSKSGRSPYCIFAIALTFHTLSILFIFIWFLISFFRNIKYFYILMAILFFSYLTLDYAYINLIILNLSWVPFVGPRLFLRMADISSLNDQSETSQLFLILIIGFISTFMLFIYIQGKMTSYEKRIYLFFIVINVLVLILRDIPLLQYRIFMIIYFLFPFVLVDGIKNSGRIGFLSAALASALLFINFTWSGPTTWKYPSQIEIMTLNPFTYHYKR